MVYRVYSGPMGWDIEETFHRSTLTIKERIYLHVLPAHLDTVWPLLEQIVFNPCNHVKFAKRCTFQDASRRRDTIVIYTDSADGTADVIRRLRLLFRPLPDPRGGVARPAKLQQTFFGTTIPRVTLPVPGYQGISTASDPGSGTSYGDLLSSALAAAYASGPANEGEFVALSMQKLSDSGVDLRTPWLRQ